MNLRPFPAAVLGFLLLAGLVAGTVGLGHLIATERSRAVPPGPAMAAAPPSAAPAAVPLGRPATAPRPGDLAPPPDGGAWPWPVGGPGLSAPALPVRLPATESAHWGAAVSPAAGQAVVALHDPRKPGVTSLLWCDLTEGTVTDRWEVKGRLGVFDLAPDGRKLLAQKAEANGTDLGVLELFTRGAGDRLDQKKWSPFAGSGVSKNVLTVHDGDASGSGPEHPLAVAWAGFVGRRHLATVSVAGTLRVWDAGTLKQTGEFLGVAGRPAVTPDGAKLAFLSDRSVSLFDPDAGKVVGTKVLGRLPDRPALAWRPDGKVLACGGVGRTTFLDMGSGKVWDAVMPELKFATLKDRALALGRVPAFGWAGDRHLFHDGKLFEIDAPVPVWEYTGSAWAGVRGRQVWSVVRHGPDGKTAPATLRADTLPDPAAKAGVKTALARPGAFALKPGDAVKVDVSRLAADRREAAREGLERRAKEAGFMLKPDAAVALVASVDTPGVEDAVTYGSATVFFTWRPARLKLTRGGKTLWEAEAAVPPPPAAYVGPNGEVDSAGFGNPDYDLFTARPIPAVVRGGDSAGVFGASEFTPTGPKTAFVAREAQASPGKSE